MIFKYVEQQQTTIEQQQTTIEQQQTTIEQQQEEINHLTYRPGGPGAAEASEHYVKLLKQHCAKKTGTTKKACTG